MHLPDPPESRFINRELSWLAFNERVLEEAENRNHPLLERLRFLSISANNLDEFYMVRVAGLKGQQAAGIATPSQDGLTPAQQLAAINVALGELMRDQQASWRRLRDELRANGRRRDRCGRGDGRREAVARRLLPRPDLSGPDAAWRWIPRIRSPSSPISASPSSSSCAAPRMGDSFAPWSCCRRRWRASCACPGKAIRFLPLEAVIGMYLDRLFPGFGVAGLGYFRMIRDSEMEIEEEAEDLVRLFESALKRRRRGTVIRLEANADMAGGSAAPPSSTS